MEIVKRKFDLEDRLVEFACKCLIICDKLPFTKSGQNLSYQLSKSSTAAALIFGEAQAAESKADFIHKMKMVLKEVRETRVNLKIIQRKPLLSSPDIPATLTEANELLAIFIKSIETAKNRSPSS